ncbi:hypothetical protein CEXT_600701 [Caerostris extrusa]|uniref:Uncharacterized protein n=1 Tax=Caerostris extrusa TaxID=172846 RepID=A0AAV4NFG4_CAEEX|nr:hypothetical protein CEXT_600701 [Caerostris extrusa]
MGGGNSSFAKSHYGEEQHNVQNRWCSKLSRRKFPVFVEKTFTRPVLLVLGNFSGKCSVGEVLFHALILYAALGILLANNLFFTGLAGVGRFSLFGCFHPGCLVQWVWEIVSGGERVCHGFGFVVKMMWYVEKGY